MGDLILLAMAGIVHDECSLCLLLPDDAAHLGISVACCRRHTGVDIPHHFLHLIVGIGCHDGLGGLVDICHVQVVVAVVTHEHDCVFPAAAVLVFGIADGFVHQGSGIRYSRHREASHSEVFLVTAQEVAALTVVHEGEPSVVDIAVGLAEGVFALVSQQVVVRVEMAARRGQHSVVPYTVAEEQERLRQAAAGGTVVEHLHVASVGHCVRRSAGELVVQFVSRNDTYRKVVVRTVEGGQPFGLFQELLACRNDDDHVGRSVCMMVLVGDVVDVFRYREVRFQRGCRCWCRIGHGDVIEPCRTACCSRNLDAVDCAEVVECIASYLLITLVERVVGCYSYFTEVSAVRLQLHRRGIGACRDGYGKPAGCGMCLVGQGEDFALVQLQRCLLKEIPSAVIPAEVVHLVQTVIVSGRGIEAVEELRAVCNDGRCAAVVLCQEVTAIIRIRIPDSPGRCVLFPADRAAGIEEPPAACVIGRDFLQVVVRSDEISCQHFVLQVAAIAIDFHLVYV